MQLLKGFYCHNRCHNNSGTQLLICWAITRKEEEWVRNSYCHCWGRRTQLRAGHLRLSAQFPEQGTKWSSRETSGPSKYLACRTMKSGQRRWFCQRGDAHRASTSKAPVKFNKTSPIPHFLMEARNLTRSKLRTMTDLEIIAFMGGLGNKTNFWK